MLPAKLLRPFALLASLLILLLGFPMAAQAQSLLQNGAFPQHTAGWYPRRRVAGPADRQREEAPLIMACG